eukprot:TRINITY_DN5288_c0_g1_i3.p1 TRINITY_DN5288_c0_g1~~TRINITY_DN5288_c0_g1_i3.p1  ORF type:complete len:267 (+),score=34.98 TRINITY_DN5288_c0_g1_i3:370-1170(+)
MTYACNAMVSSRDAFSPYPSGILDPVTGNPAFLDEHGKKNISAISTALASLTPIRHMAEAPCLKTHLAGNPLGYSLFRWILASNRSHMIHLPVHSRIPGIDTEQQYVVCASNPAREADFRALRASVAANKKGKGSFFAFHGSRFGNWHCILRVGLKNYSNTPMMSAGAAHGKGIYLAQHSSTSMGYMGAGTGWPHSSLQGNLTCIALCEVIDMRGTPEIKSTGGIYVVPDEKLVAIRYLFIFDATKTSSIASIDADKLKLPDRYYS